MFRQPTRLCLLGFVCAAVIAGSAAAASPAGPCHAVSYHSVPALRAQRMCMNAGVRTHGTERGTYLFVTPGNGGTGIYQDNGNLVWWNPPGQYSADYDAQVVHWHGQPYVAVWHGQQRHLSNGTTINEGTILLYDEHYQQVGEITAAGNFYKKVANVAPGHDVDPHEFRITPQGDALIDVTDPVQMDVHGHEDLVENYVVQKLSLVQDASGIHTGKLLFQWQSLQHVPLAQSHVGDPDSTKTFWDYFHGNSVSQDRDGNLVISGRNTWGIYKVDVKTGKIMWQVGAKGDSKLGKPWCYQHDITALGNNEYSVFDDGAVGPKCEPGRDSHPSRGLIFRVDPSQRPAGVKLIHAYPHHPPLGSSWLGSAQQEANGDVLVGYGNIPELTEYSANGRAVNMDLTLSAVSYRALRFAWVGQPTQPPAVAAKLRAGGTQVWASWNGATQVTAWRVEAGPTPTTMVPVTGAQPKTGFETAIFVKHPYAHVAVQALGAKGQVLGTSAVVGPSG
jgi:Arylsulfotransferase (ASST)